MKRFVDIDPAYFIRYDNDTEIVSAYYQKAREYGNWFLEGEAFPEQVKLGDRTFGEWKHVCDQAVGRIFMHLDFADLLKKKHAQADLLGARTLFARREDIAAVWIEAGLDLFRVESTMKAMTLEITGLEEWENAYETPCHFYVDLGKDFVLMPSFGAISNPYFALFRHLRTTYKADWDRGVDTREAVFRADLRNVFQEPRYSVAPNGFRINRPDGTMLTDIDATILDRKSGRLALVQLKWHDIFGRSLFERESRKSNMNKANEWVHRVDTWLNGKSSKATAHELGLRIEASEEPPLLFVIARYVARFSGSNAQDKRASWMGWSEIRNCLDRCASPDPLAELPSRIEENENRFRSLKDYCTEFSFIDLKVRLNVSHA